MDYPNFLYNDYKILEDEENIYFKYDFEIEGLVKFAPQLVILKKDFKWKHLHTNALKNIVFNLGMVEAISYFKATCSKNFIIKCGALNEEQSKWFRKLFFLGLGEFRYINKIETKEEDFVNFVSLGKPLELEEIPDENSGVIVPVGGGKDSNVTLELLKNNFDITPFRIGTQEVAYECMRVAGFERSKAIEVRRVIDNNLLTLNQKGFLNGHTPFSAMVAFLIYAIGFMLDKKYIALSNENSANESNVDGENINHQYSKTLEFENDFREYAKKYLKGNVEYFSFLRPISELQIAMLFAKYKKYHKVFKSCNPGSKQNPWVWCGECPKCLFVYTILSPFLKSEELKEIFGSNLFEKESLLETFIELCGFGKIKPFECVGTFSEVRYSVSKAIENYKEEELPFLLKYYKEHFEKEDTSSSRLKAFNENNNLPVEFQEILRKAID
jgi:hypothetical protein